MYDTDDIYSFFEANTGKEGKLNFNIERRAFFDGQKEESTDYRGA